MKKYNFIFISAVLAFMACSNEDNPIPAPVEPITPVEDIVLPEANLADIKAKNIELSNDFTINLFKTSFSLATDKNVCISPASISMILSMLANGDTGEGRDEILKLLGYDASEEGLRTLNETNYILLSALPEVDKENVKYEVSNSFWHPENVEVQKNFVDRITNYYHAEEILKSSAGEEGKAAINAFVNEKTYGLIPDFLKAHLINSETLLNTTYFKACWKNLFIKAENNPSNFFWNLDGTKSKADYMEYDGDYFNTVMDNIICIDIPYGNGDMSMTIFCPVSPASGSFYAMVESLTAEKMKTIIDDLEESFIVFTMPEFTQKCDYDMTTPLKELGFTPSESGYNNILAEGNFGFTSLFHSTKLIVNKDGTEGAAASIVGIPEGGHAPVQFSIMNPFVYVIREHTTGAIIFIGAVTSIEKDEDDYED